MKRWILTGLVVLATVLALGATAMALGPDRDRGGPSSPVMSSGTHGMMAGPMSSGRRGRMHGWMQGMRVTSERAWLTEMVAHHTEAVTAARQLERSGREEMRDFGAAIVETQSAQIDRMNGWLEKWYGGPAAGVRYRPMMRDLSGLSGERLDRVFLQDMIGHHMMAVMMSQQLLLSGLVGHQPVADLAREIRDGQHQEIFQMQEWLAAWFGGGSYGMHPGTGPGMRHDMMRGWGR